MINIRYGLYETNSSSVHCLVIPKDTNLYIPKRVHLTGGEYGWEFGSEGDTINYIYQACVDSGREEVERFIAYLKSKGVEEIDCPELRWTAWGDGEYAENNPGYIDHGYEIPLNDLFANENLLDRFLFGGGWVDTGNDNSDDPPDEDDYDHDKYDVIEKGN